MNIDGVTCAFEIISEEIEKVANAIADQGIKMFQKKKFEGALSLAETGKKLKAFQEKVDAVLDEWQNSFDTKTRKQVEIKGIEEVSGQPKSKRTRLRITLKDKSVIEEHVAADTFIEVLRLIGFERVEKLGIAVRGVPLVGTLKSNDYQQRLIDGKYVITHSSTSEKRDRLMEISETLGLGLLVEIV